MSPENVAASESAIERFASSLALMQPVSSEKIDKLLSFCPDALAPAQMLSVRGQQAVRAVSQFVISTRLEVNTVLALLLRYLAAAAAQAAADTDDAKPDSELVAFTRTLLVQLGRVALALEDQRPNVVQAVLDFIQSSFENNVPSATLASLLALADAALPLWEASQIELLRSLFSRQLKAPGSAKTKVVVLRAMRQLTKLGDLVGHDVCSEFFDSASEFLSLRQRGSSKQTFVPAVELIVDCGLLSETLSMKVAYFLRDFLAAYFQPGQTYNNWNSAFDEYKACLRGYVELAAKYSHLSTFSVDVILEALLQASSKPNLITQFTATRDEAIDTISRVLRQQVAASQGDIQPVQAMFTSLYTQFYTVYEKYAKALTAAGIHGDRPMTANGEVVANGKGGKLITSSSSAKVEPPKHTPTDEKYKETEAKLLTIILVFSKITIQFNDPRVTALILPRLLTRIHASLQSVDTLLINQLTEICLLGQPEPFEEIVAEFINIFKRVLHDPQTHVSTMAVRMLTMPNAFETLASNVSDKALRESLLLRVLRLFQQLGKEAGGPAVYGAATEVKRPAPSRDTSEMTLMPSRLQGMGYLLPILAELARDYDETKILDPDPDSDIQKLFRSVYFYCVLFRFVEKRSWRSDWFDAVRKFSSRTPVLVSKRPDIFKKTELEIEALLQNGFTDKDVRSYSQFLAELLPGQAAVKALLPTQTVYLLSIYHLETLRAASGTFQGVFSYLEDPGLKNQTALLDCIKGIADTVFPVFADSIVKSVDPALRPAVLEAETQALMLKCCSRSLPARYVAQKYIAETTSRFPQVLWSRNCLQTLLDVIEAVGKSCESTARMTGTVKLPHASSLSVSPVVGPLPAQIYLPDDHADRQALLRQVAEVGAAYLKFAIGTAPQQTHAVLQEYMVRFQEISRSFDDHIGYSLALETSILNVNRLIQDAKRDPARSLSGGAVELVSPAAGLVAAPSCVTSHGSSFVNSVELKARYLGEVQGALGVLQGDGVTPEASSQRLAAMLCTSLRKLSQDFKATRTIEFSAFNQSLFRAVALLISDASAQELLHLVAWIPVLVFTPTSLQSAVTAWSWLLTARPDLSVSLMTEIASAWSWTVEERLGLFSDAVRKPSPLAVSTVGPSATDGTEAAWRSDVGPHQTWINFLAERFVVIRDTNPTELRILTRMLHKALVNPDLLSYMPLSVCCRFRLLLLCLKVLHSDVIGDNMLETLLRERVYQAALGWFNYKPNWFDPGRREQLVDDVNQLIAFGKELAQEQVFEKRNVDRLAEMAQYYESFPDAKPQEIFLIRNMQKARELITLLIGNELERIVVWTNPCSRLSLQIPDQDRFAPPAKTSTKYWQNIVETAWEISPKLSVNLAQRFPASKTVKRVLEKLVRRYPTAVLDVAEAIPLLVNEVSVRENIPELKYLLYWCNCTPPVALGFFQKMYNSHPLVTQYAVRVLRSFPPETIIYYIPQLVQALRYDDSQMVSQYLREAATHSDLLAHQIIWNLQTYTVSDPSTAPASSSASLSRKAADLLVNIKNDFSSSARQRYEEEFDFIDRVTRISGILMDVHPDNKEARKPLLRQELAKITLESTNLYLPSNPDVKVHGIIPESSTTLQSAAKQPILVWFHCHSRESEYQLEHPRSLAATDTFLTEEEEDKLTAEEEHEARRRHRMLRRHGKEEEEEADGFDWKYPAFKLPAFKSLRESELAALNLPAPVANGKAPVSPPEVAASEHRSSDDSDASTSSVDSSSDVADAPHDTPGQSSTPKALVAAVNSAAKIAWSGSFRTGCIFKVNDDIRQDMLALQVIGLFHKIFQQFDLDLFLYPYKVIATSPQSGIIEVVPNATSRDQLGKKFEGGLAEYFLFKYGPPHTETYQKARLNFVKSLSAYSVISFILQVKDRHNGNIMLDEEGHIIHIDFGFIFDSSPGGNMGFETAPFKLSAEMIDILGGRPDAEPFKFFMEQGIKAFLAARKYSDSIMTLVRMMLDTQLPCFRKDTMEHLQARLAPHKTEKAAAKHMMDTFITAFSSFSSFTTNFYDYFQAVSQGIDY
eukprot:TRINITY_DN7253_c0_g1_i2.p1 TRINITY_DN7253_c0_g1~~TRINITY_DN7253_c0_g1_i2.p1  ORF type:complete len:2046 (+),score=784.72 TRINITY_DN7253_c0_g1_i2:171-6308(+)